MEFFRTWLLLGYCLSQLIILYVSGCKQKLGMEDKNIIRDDQIYAPPEVTAGGSLPSQARLNGNSGWCVANSRQSNLPHFKKDHYIEVDLGKMYQVTGLLLQGKKDQGFSYGEKFQLQHKMNKQDSFVLYKQKDGSADIKTKNLATGTEEILLDSPIVTRYIRWFPVIDQNHKCVRMEILGCSLAVTTVKTTTQQTSLGCDNAILTFAFNDDKYFSESSAQSRNGKKFPGLFILFDLPFGWCPDTSKYTSTVSNPYQEWVSVDLNTTYRVVAIQSGGYKTTVDSKDELHLIDSYALEYKSDDASWTRYRVADTIKIFSRLLTKTKTKLENPFTARYVRLRPKIDSNTTKCVKFQLFGCKVVPTAGPVTTPGVTFTATKPERVVALSYKTYQGSNWEGLRFTDSTYSGNISSANVLYGGSGLLTDNSIPTESPLKMPKGWIGWAKVRVQDPFLQFYFKEGSILSTVKMVMFVDRKRGFDVFNHARFSYNKVTFDSPLHVCPLSATRSRVTGFLTVAFELGNLKLNTLKMTFSYCENWLVVGEVTFNAGTQGALMYKVFPSQCPVIGTTRQDSGSSIGMIIGAVVGCLLVIIIIVILIILWRRSSSRVRRTKKTSTKQEMELLTSMKPNPIYDQGKNGTGQNYTEVFVDNGNEMKTPLVDSNVVYAAPDVGFMEDVGPPGYSAIEDIKKPPGYTEISLDYAEPGSPTSPEKNPDDFQFNPIYEETYENPYKAVTGSSMYADPEKQSGRKSFEIKKFPRQKLKHLEKIGSGQFGEVIICEVDRLGEILGPDTPYGDVGRALVAVKTLKSGVDKSVEKEFMKEVRVMARLEHENVVNLLGVCDDEPKCMVVEYMENGDLNQFLKDSKPYEGPENPRVSQLPQNVLLVDTLMYMATQIASGMKYLSSHGFIHRDLATRNCLVGPAFTVKVSDFGMSRYLYSKQYYRIEGKAILPIRWMAPESLFYGKFTSYTDVWAFGITMWELFSYARQTPYANMTDQQVIDNACSFVQERRKLFQYLRQPAACPGDVYSVMMQCWAKTPEDRPTFDEIFSFFIQKVESQEGSI